MREYVYSDGSDLCLVRGEEKVRGSDFIANYKERSRQRVRRDEWKYTGAGARFRGDTFEDHGIDENAPVDAYINGVCAAEEGKIFYTFTVNDVSGVIRKDMDAQKNGEDCILHTTEGQLGAADFNRTDGKFAASMRRDLVTGDLILMDTKNGDYYSITEGDSLDENPCFSRSKEGKLLFNSYPVGRYANGEFCEYGASEVCSYDLRSMEIEVLASNPKYSYIKPQDDAQGNLYCIRKPVKEKKKGNPLLEIILIPYRILQAIVNFIQIFVVFFSGKTLTGGGNNPAKGRNVDSRELFIRGNVIKVDEEIKRNKKFKDSDLSFIPQSWKLVRLGEQGEEELKSGICDFCVTDEGIFCTNGKKIFLLRDGKKEVLKEGDLILNVSAPVEAKEAGKLFEME